MNPLHQFQITSRGDTGVERGSLEGASKVGMRTARQGSVNRNVREADGVFLIGSKSSPHAEFIRNRCEKLGKPLLRTRYLWKTSTQNRMLQQAKLLANWILDHDMTTIYITGDEGDRIEGFTEALIITAAQELRYPGILPHKVGETKRQQRMRLRKQEKLERRTRRMASVKSYIVKK